MMTIMAVIAYFAFGAMVIFVIGYGLYRLGCWLDYREPHKRKRDTKDGYDRAKIIQQEWNDYLKFKSTLQLARQEQLDEWDNQFRAIDAPRQAKMVADFADQLESEADRILQERNPEVWARIQQLEIEKTMRDYGLSRAAAIDVVMNHKKGYWQ